MQLGNINTNMEFNIYYTLPEFSETKIMTWKYHVDESAKTRYDTILGRYLLT